MFIIYPGDTLTTGIWRATWHEGKKERRTGSISCVRHLQTLHLIFPCISKMVLTECCWALWFAVSLRGLPGAEVTPGYLL